MNPLKSIAIGSARASTTLLKVRARNHSEHFRAPQSASKCLGALRSASEPRSAFEPVSRLPDSTS
eukprot:4604010-Pleurochrysis_carterae.AAC.1